MLIFAEITRPPNMATININTSLGDIKVRLYDETPIHRDNFLKLVQEGFYNGTLFHRVIENFMIQGGDPDSREAAPEQMLGTGGPGYTLPAEIVTGLYHKRGAIAAARMGDEMNPNRESSGSQFYIVWGQTYNKSKLKQLEKQMLQQMEQQRFNALAASHKDEIMNLRRSRDREGVATLQERLVQQAQQEVKTKAPLFNEEMYQVYEETGGTPFLDGQYTVFGEVTQGLEVVEKLQSVTTDMADRPVQDLKIQVTIED